MPSSINVSIKEEYKRKAKKKYHKVQCVILYINQCIYTYGCKSWVLSGRSNEEQETNT